MGNFAAISSLSKQASYDELFKSDSVTGSLALTLSWPLFDGFLVHHSSACI